VPTIAYFCLKSDKNKEFHFISFCIVHFKKLWFIDKKNQHCRALNAKSNSGISQNFRRGNVGGISSWFHLDSVHIKAAQKPQRNHGRFPARLPNVSPSKSSMGILMEYEQSVK
jgi:hypothetical protein